MNVPELPPSNWFQRHIINVGWRWGPYDREVSTLERFCTRYIVSTWSCSGIRVVHAPWFPFRKGTLFIWGDCDYWPSTRFREILGINLKRWILNEKNT
jgi:hypothetical protein